MPQLLDAIEFKYGTEYGRDSSALEEVPIGILVPRVGPRKSIPRLLILNDCGVDSAGDEGILEKTIGDILELDLASNSLTQWNEVCKILNHIPSATFLNLSFNHLNSQLIELTGVQNNLSIPLLPCLNTLILIGTKIAWDSLWLLLKKTSSLQELHLSLNGFECVSMPRLSMPTLSTETEANEDESVASSAAKSAISRLSESTDSGHGSSGGSDDEDMSAISFPSLKRLMFDGNPIESWKEISKLGQLFPSLRHLGLGNCPISSIRGEGCNYFESLGSLTLSNTLINELDSISALNGLEALTEIKVQGIPLLNELTAYERRQLLIALLPRMCKINGGGPISSNEREDAERAFIRRYSNNAGDDPQSPPPARYHELIEIHGALCPLADICLSPATEIKIRLCYEKQLEDRMLNVYLTTSELKKMLEEIFGIPPSTQVRLFYIDPELKGIFGREEMRLPTKQLHSYNISDGNEIHIELK